MKEKKEGPSPMSQLKDSDDAFEFSTHRRSNSFSSLAKAYKLKADKSRTKLNKSSTSDADDTQQLIAILEHQVSEGDKAKRELVLEIAKLKDQLHRAEAQIALLKQANNNLHGQLLDKEKSPQLGRLPVRPIDVQLCLK
jgi:chromosome segregation ATPase